MPLPLEFAQLQRRVRLAGTASSEPWSRLVVGSDGRIDRRLYEIAVLAHLRNKLRSGDV